MFVISGRIILLIALGCLITGLARNALASEPVVDCYTPIDGGWQIAITDDPAAPRLEPGSQIGVVERGKGVYAEGHAWAAPASDDNPRLHRRPLYPPADKDMVWSAEEQAKFPNCSFRPMVLAYNEPRFLFDYHGAGGLLGHLVVGMTGADGASKWFHQWSAIEVRYVDGRMEYTLRDPAFPGVTAHIAAAATADCIGVVLKVKVEGLRGPAQLVWAYGGASAYFTCYAFTAPEFTYAPEQCAKDRYTWDGNAFALHRAFAKPDVILEQPFAAARFLPDWQATICGGSSWKGTRGFGRPEAFMKTPAELCGATDWTEGDTAERTNCVVVERAGLDVANEGGIVVGMGGQIRKAIRRPRQAFKAALERNAEIASRIVTHTPDPYLDAAVRMMAFATEGTWGAAAYVHGGWSWRFAYLGWRIWYGPDCYGWTDRVRASIQNHIKYGLIKQGDDAGALSSLIDTPGGVYYNMNEVFLDHVRHYFDYTNDLDLMREIFPVLVGIVEWESRRLQPGDACLYESALDTWISDSHWYIQGQCTQASAYMLDAYRLLADLAQRLGQDPAPFKARADCIHEAMQKTLWMPRAGVFAEYRDTRGYRLLHTEPELPTLYHSAEFGAADPLQIYSMTHWADTHLRTAATPGGGMAYWSSNWFPNNGRNYTHSTYELAYGEEMNFALTQYLAGRADQGYALLRASLCGVFNGPTPGGLACHMRTDGRQRANDEFADASSMWARAVVEGLFGIAPKRPQGYVALTPQLPSDWPEASIDTPAFSYKMKREAGSVSIAWKSPVETSVHLRLPVQAASIDAITSDGTALPFHGEAGAGLTWVVAETPVASHGAIRISVSGTTQAIPGTLHLKQGDRLDVSIDSLRSVEDPEGVLKDAHVGDGRLMGTVQGDPGPVLVFAGAGTAACPVWLPVRIEIEPEQPKTPPRVWKAPEVPAHDLAPWTVVDLQSTFNTTIADALDKVSKEATPPPPGASQVGFGYWKSHMGDRYHGTPTQVTSDAAWRAKVGDDGVAWTTDGIPFKTAKEGPNIGVVTQTGPFATRLEFPVKASGKTLYLMLSGITFPTQSHVTQLRVTLRYASGAVDSKDLMSPTDIGDCWSTWCGRWHDTAANGFENLGGRSGPAGSSQVEDMTKPVSVDTEAHLVPFALRPEKLDVVRIEAVANDVIFGVMGATILN